MVMVEGDETRTRGEAAVCTVYRGAWGSFHRGQRQVPVTQSVSVSVAVSQSRCAAAPGTRHQVACLPLLACGLRKTADSG